MAAHGVRAGRRLPVAAFVPLVAVSLGVQRHASLQGGSDAWSHAAGVHVAAAIVLAGVLLATRLRVGRNHPGVGAHDDVVATRKAPVYGAALLTVSTLLVLWSQNTLSYAATGITAITAALLALRKSPGGTTRAFAIPALLAVGGVLLLIFGRNVGLGLQIGPTLYLPLSRGPRSPDASTLTALLALLAAGAAWAALWRRARTHGYQRSDAGQTRTTLLLIAPGAGALLAATALSGDTPAIGTWTLLGGVALAASVHGTMRLAAGASTAAAGTATLGGCLTAAVATRVHYGNAFTSPMLAGAGLVVAGLLLTRHQVRRHTTGRITTP